MLLEVDFPDSAFPTFRFRVLGEALEFGFGDGPNGGQLLAALDTNPVGRGVLRVLHTNREYQG